MIKKFALLASMAALFVACGSSNVEEMEKKAEDAATTATEAAATAVDAAGDAVDAAGTAVELYLIHI